MPVLLADECAMSQERSPFRTVGSLANHAEAMVIQRGGKEGLVNPLSRLGATITSARVAVARAGREQGPRDRADVTRSAGSSPAATVPEIPSKSAQLCPTATP